MIDIKLWKQADRETSSRQSDIQCFWSDKIGQHYIRDVGKRGIQILWRSENAA